MNFEGVVTKRGKERDDEGVITNTRGRVRSPERTESLTPELIGDSGSGFDEILI
jgi:hypothetical protein